MFRLLIAGGGTGGHIIPAAAVAEEFMRRAPDTDVLVVGTGRPLEAQILGPRGLTLRKISAAGFMGVALTRRVMSLALVPVGFVQSAFILFRFRPHLVFCVGGYSAGPVGLAAKLFGFPMAVHEQNSVPGMTNKLLGRLADIVLIAFEEARGSFPGAKTHLVGNPLPRELVELGKTKAEGKQKKEEDSIRVLIVGGSQGAHAVNLAVIEAMRVLSGRAEARLEVIHQTGTADYEMVRQAYQDMGFEAEVKPFIHEMGQAYLKADLAVCRAGALTVAEVAAFGLPALFIPLPSESGHQDINAQSLVEAGGAEIIPQKDLSPEILADKIASLIKDRPGLEQMGRQSASAARLNAAREIYDICLNLVSSKGKKRVQA